MDSDQAIRVIKQHDDLDRVPQEDRQYVESPEDVPEEAQALEGEGEDVWFYDESEVPDEEIDINQDISEEYNSEEWVESHKDFSGLEVGDTVDVYSDVENDIYHGEIINHEFAEEDVVYEIEFDDNSTAWYKPNEIRIESPKSPTEGKEIEIDEYKEGDKIRYYRFGEMKEGIVDDVDDGTVLVANESGGTDIATSSKHRASRITSAQNVSASEYSKTIDINSSGIDDDNSELMNQISNVVSSINSEDVAKSVVDGIEEVIYKNEGNWWDKTEHVMSIDEGADKDAVAHEFSHALEDVQGFDVDPEEKGTSLLAEYQVEHVLPLEFGRQMGDVIVDAVEELEQRRGTTELNDEVKEQLRNSDKFNQEIEKEDFKLTKVDEDIEHSEEFEELVDAVNSSWERIADLASEGEFKKAEIISPKIPYSASNASELLATTNEIFQASNGNEAHIMDFWRYHPEIMYSYLDNFEPSDEAKSMMNKLQVSDDEKDRFVRDIPFPEVLGKLKQDDLDDVPPEHRQYVDRPEEVPEEAEPRRGEEPNTWFYDVRQVSEARDWPDGYNEREWIENNQLYDGIKIGDGVDVYSEEDNDIFTGEVVGRDVDRNYVGYKVEFEDGSTGWFSPEKIKIQDAFSPDEGEQIPVHEYERGDKVKYAFHNSIQEGIVVDKGERDELFVLTENGRVMLATSSGYRAAKIEDKQNVDPSDYARTVDISSERVPYEDDMRNEIAEVTETVQNENIARKSVDEIEHIKYKSSASNHWNKETKEMAIERGRERSVVAHEFTHALADAHGFETDPESKGVHIITKFQVEDILPIKFGERLGDVIIAATDRLQEARNIKGLDDENRETLENSDEYDPIVKKEDFMLQKEDEDIETSEELEKLISDINSTWEEIAEIASNGEYNRAEIRCPLRPYAGSNASEMFATVNQIFQSTNGDEVNLRTIWEFHPNLMHSYLDVFEPSKPAKKFLNALQLNDSVEDHFNEVPFPEVKP